MLYKYQSMSILSLKKASIHPLPLLQFRVAGKMFHVIFMTAA